MSGFDPRLETVFEEALRLENPEDRESYLNRVCAEPEFRQTVESLLRAHARPDPIFTQIEMGKPVARRDPLPKCVDFSGQTIDQKYRLDHLLGRGGMGAVYRGVHLGTGRCVAVKLIAPEFMRNQEFVRRFQREARAAGQLRHPHIVDVTDFGVTRVDALPTAYLVMEYLDGFSLEEALAGGLSLPLNRVVEVIEQVCSAVHAAHQLGVIHRDLKPANIWLEPSTLGGYRVRVLDFGIAKLGESTELAEAVDVDSPLKADPTIPNEPPSPRSSVSAPSPSNGSDSPTIVEMAVKPSLDDPEHIGADSNLTRMGMILGTPAYMSPEQCRGGALDARSDVYSLGVIAYEMLAGRRPFVGDVQALLQAHQNETPPSLVSVARHTPGAVAAWIMQALSKVPSQRPASAQAFALTLRAHSEGLGALYRKAAALYSEFLPLVLSVSLLAHVPVLLVSTSTMAWKVAVARFGFHESWEVDLVLGVLRGVATFVASSTIAGAISTLVVGLAGAPLKPVSLRSTLTVVSSRLRPLLRTGLRVTAWILIGAILLLAPALLAMVWYTLWAPIVLLEGLEGRAALDRSRTLISRSWKTGFMAVLFQLGLPALVQAALTRLIHPGGAIGGDLFAKLTPELVGWSGVVVTPLVSIVMALVYLKMRQIGGEPLSSILSTLHSSDAPISRSSPITPGKSRPLADA